MSNPLFQTWQDTLTEVAENGRLLAAAKEALRLEATPDPLAELIREWQTGDFSQLPAVELLSSEAMSGARGAYARSNETIYLNEDWLSTASEEEAIAVLMEELGHHLDNVVNEENTPGDEQGCFILGVKIGSDRLKPLWSGAIAHISSDLTYS